MTTTHIKGFVIYCPHTKGHYAHHTFGVTSYEAWVRHCRSTYDDKDISRKIQAWHDTGYRLREATLIIHSGEDENEPQGNPSIKPDRLVGEKG